MDNLPNKHLSTAFLPSASSSLEEQQETSVASINPEKFKNQYDLACLDTVRTGALSSSESDQLKGIVRAFIAKASDLADKKEAAYSLKILFDFAKNKLKDEALTQRAKQALVHSIQDAITDIRTVSKQQARDEAFVAMELELRPLFSLLSCDPDSSHLVESRIWEIEQKMDLDLPATVKGSIANLSGRQLPAIQSAPPAEYFGELFNLPMEHGEYVLRTDAGAWRIASYASNKGDLVALVSADVPGMSITVTSQELAVALEGGTVDRLLEQAQRTYAEERNNREQLQSYQLPGNGGVHLRMFPRAFDNTVSTNISSSMLFAKVLHRCYPALQTPPILFTDNPVRDVEHAVQEQYAKGQRFFLLDFYNHGSEEALLFQHQMKADDILRIAEKFPQAKFQINTIACFGGGLRKGLLQALERLPANTPERQNIILFAQVKPHTPNFSGDSKTSRLPDAWNQSSSTPYYLYLMQSLLEGKSYGEAHADADAAAKELIFTDAEALWNGHLFTMNRDAHSSSSVVAGNA